MCLFKGYSYNRVSAPVPPVGAALVHFKLCSLLLSNSCCCKEMGGNFIERKIMKKIKIKGSVKIACLLSILTLYIIAYFSYFK